MKEIVLNQENFIALVQIVILMVFTLIAFGGLCITVHCKFKKLREELLQINLLEPTEPIDKLNWLYELEMKRWHKGNCKR
jgi:hypothetical protein